MAERLIRPGQLPDVLGVGRQKSIELREIDGFPVPRRIPGTQLIGYLESEIDAWLRSLERVA